MLVLIIVVFIIGILAGGVVNVLADDLPKRRAPQFPPRYPDDTPRPPTAWFGVTAFLFNQRTAPNGEKLRWRYPATELLTAGLMVLTVLATSDDPAMTPIQLVFWLIYMAIFALITVIDLEHRLILFVVIIPSAVIALIDALVTTYGASLTEAVIGGLVGFGVFFLLYMGGFLFVYIMSVTRGYSANEVAFGYGDVMLIMLAGLILGWQPLIPAMFLTVFIGAIGSLLWLLSKRISRTGYSMFTPLPYGQYIVIAVIIMLLFGTEVTNILLRPA